MASLINLAKQTNPNLFVTASGYGDGKLDAAVAQASDFLTPHLNSVAIVDYAYRLGNLAPYNKAIVVNEDLKDNETGALAAETAVANGASWGFFWRSNQSYAFIFEGYADDPIVYDKIIQLTTTPIPPPDNTAPVVSITSPLEGADVTGTIAVTANASDDVGVAGVQFQVNGVNVATEDTTNPYSINLDTTPYASTSITLTAVARDAAGNVATSAAVTINVLPPPPPPADDVIPTVSITNPLNGATVSGMITLSADASDNVGVAGVQFRLNGVNIGAEDTTNPYSISLDTAPYVNTSITLTAVARDAAGNVATSAAVTINVVAVPAGQAVISFTLINADTNQDIMGLTNGMTISFAALGTPRLNIRANTSPAIVGSVKFGFDASSNYRTENGTPYALAGNSNNPLDYYAWSPSIGSHTITGTPYTSSNAGGTKGSALIVNFTVTQ